MNLKAFVPNLERSNKKLEMIKITEAKTTNSILDWNLFWHKVQDFYFEPKNVKPTEIGLDMIVKIGNNVQYVEQDIACSSTEMRHFRSQMITSSLTFVSRN